MKHELFTEEDLLDASDEDKSSPGGLYDCVVNKNMKICKICGKAEEGLKEPCKRKYIGDKEVE